MADMLVNLLKLPPLAPRVERLAADGILIRRAQPFEQTPVRRFVHETFSPGWADEISVAYAHMPVTLFIATHKQQVIGFAAYECTRRAFFGPTGVAEPSRRNGIGTTLLLAGLHGLADLGYVYGIIGGVGPVEFYQRAVGATVIPDSTPGIYTDIIRQVK